jgi:hypothetical protein
MQDLQRDFAALLVYRIGDMAVMSEMAGVVKHRAARHGDAGRRGAIPPVTISATPWRARSA